MVVNAPPWMGRLPTVDGEVRTDPASLELAELDFGKVHRRRPSVVVRPATARDVATMVAFCRRERIPCAARGAAHSAGAQMQTEGGIVLDMTSLSAILDVSDDALVCEAGAMWRAVLEAAVAIGRTPPVVTDWLEVTVGGTLSMGGFGFMSFHAGTQMDHLLELDVVTGTGELVTCSPTQHRNLFDLVRGTHGQFGIITRVKMSLQPAPRSVRMIQCAYGNLRTMLHDFMRLSRSTEVDLIHAFAAQKTEASICTKMNSTDRMALDPAAVTHALQTVPGNWVYNLELCNLVPGDRWLDASTLQHLPGLVDEWELSWDEFCFRLPPLIIEERVRGEAPHPEITLFLPFSEAPDFLDQEFQRLHPKRDIGNGPVLFFPLRRSRIGPPLMRVPASEDYSMFWGLLRRADPPTASRIAEQVADNEAIYRRAVVRGAVRYTCDTVPDDDEFWRAHFGPRWPHMVRMKRQFDPEGILDASWGRAANADAQALAPGEAPHWPSPPGFPLEVGPIDHYTLIVPDAEASARFHVEVLGFSFQRIQPLDVGTAPPGGHDMLNYVLGLPGDPNRTLVITEGLTDESIFRKYMDKYGPGVHHVAYRVADLDEAFAKLRAGGIPTTSQSILTDPVSGLRQVFLDRAGPGYFLELIERTDVATSGQFVDDNMARLARSMTAYLGDAPSAPQPPPVPDSLSCEMAVDVERVTRFLLDPVHLPRWTCHKTVRSIYGRWVEIRRIGDVRLDTRRVQGGVVFQWSYLGATRSFTFWVSGDRDHTTVRVDLPELPSARRARTAEVLRAELEVLAAVLEGQSDSPSLQVARALIDEVHLEVYPRTEL